MLDSSLLTKETVPTRKFRTVAQGILSLFQPHLTHVITGLDVGGAEMMLLRLAGSELGERYRWTVVSLLSGGELVPRLRQTGAEVVELGVRRGSALSLLRALPRLWARLHALRPDLIQGWMHHGNLAAVLTAPAAVPVLWNVRKSIGELEKEKRGTRLVVRAGAPASPRVDAGIYNSRLSLQQHAELGYREARRCYIPNGFDLERFRPDADARASVRAELGLSAETRLVGLIGRLHAVKGHGVFLDAAARLLAEELAEELARERHGEAPVHFLLAGRGVTVQAPELAAHLSGGLGARVHALGERTDVPRLTAALDVACSASRYSEGFPNVLGEAMACAVPCVVTDVGDTREIAGASSAASARNSAGAEVVPPNDAEALAAAIGRQLQLSPEQRRRSGAAARQRVEREYSLSSIAQRYDRLYREVLGGEPAERIRTTSNAATTD